MIPKVTVWSGHPLHGGVEIPGDFLPSDDDSIIFWPHVMPNTAEVYVMKEDGDHVETWPNR
jgi:hypothetical protein